MAENLKVSIKNLDVHYGDKQALFNVNLNIMEKEVTSLIGPSGCGKSTLLKCINRMNDLVEICKIRGQILLDSEDINEASQDPVLLRMKIGMVFQKPNPFPKSIYDNVAFGPKLHGMAKSKEELDQIVIQSLSKSGLYEEVKDRLFEPGTGLSGGQQQRVAVARALVSRPDIIFADEPTGNLDREAATATMALLRRLVNEFDKTLVMVTHDPQAASKADRIVHLDKGQIVEGSPTTEGASHE